MKYYQIRWQPVLFPQKQLGEELSLLSAAPAGMHCTTHHLYNNSIIKRAYSINGCSGWPGMLASLSHIDCWVKCNKLYFPVVGADHTSITDNIHLS